MTHPSSKKRSHSRFAAYQAFAERLILILLRRDWRPKLIGLLIGQELGFKTNRSDAHHRFKHALEAETSGQLRSELIKRVVELLDEEPDVQRMSDNPERYLCNLLRVASYLEAPRQLAQPLYQMYRRKRLEGRWRTCDLREALLAALICNQKSDRLRLLWENALRGKSDGWLIIDQEAAIQGLRNMPPSNRTW